MPEASRFSRSSREAKAAYTLCVQVAEAIAPLAVDMRFVFDADEKSDEFRTQIRAASGDRAEFLPVRELENLFLEPNLLHCALAALCESAEVTAPELGTVESKMAELLARHDDPDLYRSGPPDAGDELRVVK